MLKDGNKNHVSGRGVTVSVFNFFLSFRNSEVSSPRLESSSRDPGLMIFILLPVGLDHYVGH